MQIDVEIDQVVIERQVIKRPAHTSRSEWLDFWSGVTTVEEPVFDFCEECNSPLWIG